MKMHSALQTEVISKENGGDLNSQRTQDKVMSYENAQRSLNWSQIQREQMRGPISVNVDLFL